MPRGEDIVEDEQLTVFDEYGKRIGSAARKEVHRIGLWHETFHCWLASAFEGTDYLYIQKRSHLKKDYPGLLDITAAGHLLLGETVADGVREVEEELGISIPFSSLTSLGSVKYSAVFGDFIDNELARLYIGRCPHTFAPFHLQKEEVSGLLRVRFSDFASLWAGERTVIQAEGFEMDGEGGRSDIHIQAERKDFVPHEQSYYEAVINRIGHFLEKP